MKALALRLPRPAAGLGPLGQRDFRLLWLGLVVANTGSWMQQVTQNWLLWELTHAPIALGFYGLCRSVPFVVVSLYAGALADRLDRRRLLLASNAINALFPLGVGTMVALGQVQPWHIYLAAALISEYARVHRMISNLIDRVASGELHVEIDRSFPLSEAAAAHAYVEGRNAFGRVVMAP